MTLSEATQSYLRNFAPEDEVLRWIQAQAQENGLPSISLQPQEGKLLHLWARACNATKILEIGTLGGYSGTWLARALPADGHLWTLEKSPTHAEVARAAFEKAGVASRVTVIEGEALGSLDGLVAHTPFDMVFMDADSGNYVNYFLWVGEYLRPGGVLAVHNALAGGNIANPNSERAQGMATFQEALLADSRFDSVLIPWGDGLLLAVKRE